MDRKDLLFSAFGLKMLPSIAAGVALGFAIAKHWFDINELKSPEEEMLSKKLLQIRPNESKGEAYLWFRIYTPPDPPKPQPVKQPGETLDDW